MLTFYSLVLCLCAGEPAADAGRRKCQLPHGGVEQRPRPVRPLPPGLHGYGGSAARVRRLRRRPLRERSHAAGLRRRRWTHGHRDCTLPQESEGV